MSGEGGGCYTPMYPHYNKLFARLIWEELAEHVFMTRKGQAPYTVRKTWVNEWHASIHDGWNNIVIARTLTPEEAKKLCEHHYYDKMYELLSDEAKKLLEPIVIHNSWRIS